MTDGGSDSNFNSLYLKSKEFDFEKMRVLNRHSIHTQMVLWEKIETRENMAPKDLWKQ